MARLPVSICLCSVAKIAIRLIGPVPAMPEPLDRPGAGFAARLHRGCAGGQSTMILLPIVVLGGSTPEAVRSGDLASGGEDRPPPGGSIAIAIGQDAGVLVEVLPDGGVELG